jgi:hypothetical protein
MRDVVSEILRRVNDAKKILEATVASGTGVDTFDKYQRLVGKTQGLDQALMIINDILTENDEEAV